MPQRKYTRKDIDKLSDKKIKIQSTLLEYGQQYILLGNLVQQQQQTGKQTQSSRQTEQQQKQQALNANDEEMHIKKLMNEMSATDQKQVCFNLRFISSKLNHDHDFVKENTYKIVKKSA